MSNMVLPPDVIRYILSYGDVNDIPKREMVFNQLLYLKKEFIKDKNECYRRRLTMGHNIRYCYHNRKNPFYMYILEKNRLKRMPKNPPKKIVLISENETIEFKLTP